MALTRAREGRGAVAFLAAVWVVTGGSSARGETPDATTTLRWRFEPGARLNVDFPFGDARLLIHRALGAGLSLSAGREGAAHRWRASLEVEPVTDVGPGASLQLVSARIGGERLWRRHLLTALDLGGVIRRLSIGDELTHTASGVGTSVEVGWRFFPAARWSTTSGVRYALSWFTTDGFAWQQVGVFVGLERLAVGPR